MNLDNIQLDNQKKILIVIFFVFIVYVDLNYILKAQLGGLNNLNPKIISLENDLKNLNHDLENMRISKGKQGVAVQKSVFKSSKILPEGKISGLMQDISNEANKLNIRIIQIRPSRETLNVKSTIPADKFTPILINLDMVCDYHNLGRFINWLENSEVFMEIQDFKISTQASDYIRQRVALTIKTYVAK